MGMFDTIWVPCPTCGKKEGFQSKSGDCLLRDYELDEAPMNVLLDVNRHSPYQCTDCNTVFEVKFSVVATNVKSVIYKSDIED